LRNKGLVTCFLPYLLTCAALCAGLQSSTVRLSVEQSEVAASSVDLSYRRTGDHSRALVFAIYTY